MTAPHSAKGRPRWGKWLLYIAVFGAVAVLIISQLPRGAYPTDLTRVGAGKPALVLAYDIQSSGGMTVMGLLDTVRGEYADRVEFLVAPLGEPNGQDFAERYRAISGSVMLFSGTGTHVRTIHNAPDADVLRQALQGLVSGSLIR